MTVEPTARSAPHPAGVEADCALLAAADEEVR